MCTVCGEDDDYVLCVSWRARNAVPIPTVNEDGVHHPP